MKRYADQRPSEGQRVRVRFRGAGPSHDATYSRASWVLPARVLGCYDFPASVYDDDEWEPREEEA